LLKKESREHELNRPLLAPDDVKHLRLMGNPVPGAAGSLVVHGKGQSCLTLTPIASRQRDNMVASEIADAISIKEPFLATVLTPPFSLLEDLSTNLAIPYHTAV
jgi:hypothetical protein